MGPKNISREGEEEMRDLKADLEICNKATPGPWECWLSAVQSGWMVRVGRGEYCDSINTAYYPENKIRTEGYGCDNTFIADLNDDEYHTYSSLQEQIANAKFIAAAREGWPHAIERAIKAEAKLDRLIEGCMRCAGEDDAEVERLRLMVESITGGLDEAIETNHYLEKQLETAIEDIEILCTRHYELADDYDKLADVCQDFCLHIEGKCFKAATDNPNRCVNFKWRG